MRNTFDLLERLNYFLEDNSLMAIITVYENKYTIESKNILLYPTVHYEGDSKMLSNLIEELGTENDMLKLFSKYLNYNNGRIAYHNLLLCRDYERGDPNVINREETGNIKTVD